MSIHATNHQRIENDKAARAAAEKRKREASQTPEEKARLTARFDCHYFAVTRKLYITRDNEDLRKRVEAFQLEFYLKHPHKKIPIEDYIAAGLIPKPCPHHLCDSSGTITEGEGDNIITKPCICEIERKQELEANR